MSEVMSEDALNAAIESLTASMDALPKAIAAALAQGGPSIPHGAARPNASVAGPQPAPPPRGVGSPNASTPEVAISKTGPFRLDNSYAFGPDASFLRSTLRTGASGQIGFQEALQYSSYLTGSRQRQKYSTAVANKAVELNTTVEHLTPAQRMEAHNQLMSEDGSYRRWSTVSSGLGSAAMGLRYGATALGTVTAASNLGSGPRGALDPYLQVEGKQGDGFLGGTIFSGANAERLTDKVQSKWAGITNWNYGADDDLAMRSAFRSVGVDMDSDAFKDLAEPLRDLKKNRGVDSTALIGDMRFALRSGDTKTAREYIDNMGRFSDELKGMNINVQSAIDGVRQFSEQMKGVGGMSRNTATSIAQQWVKDTDGLDPTLLSKQIQSPVAMALRMRASAAASPANAPFQKLNDKSVVMGASNDTTGMLAKAIGLNSVSDLDNPQVQSMFNALAMTGQLDQWGVSSTPEEALGQFAEYFGVDRKSLMKSEKGSIWNPTLEKTTGSKVPVAKVDIDLTAKAKKLLKVVGDKNISITPDGLTKGLGAFVAETVADHL